ncbi:MAG: GntR family transcriptional regulator [Chloroflexi bacterium]|nr:GntR family transcriptional regulator [Chloroflexota bacterium]
MEQGVDLGALEGAAALRERRTAQELVAAVLRHGILTGKLPGGTRLVQDQIAAQLGVSRVPVREALLQLEAEGLVRMQAHRGATVVARTPADIAELFEIRAVLLSEAVRHVVPHLTDDQIVRLQAIEERTQGEANMTARMQLTRAFYAVLLERLARPRLQAMIEKLEQEVERYLQSLERPHLGHGHIVAGGAARDGERAATLVREHLLHVGERAVERLLALREAAAPQCQVLRRL